MNWVKAVKLTLNVKRSNPLFLTHEKNSKEKPPVKLRNWNKKTWLNIYFYKQLSWSKHIEMANNKLPKGVGILTKLRKYVKKKTMKNLFN